MTKKPGHYARDGATGPQRPPAWWGGGREPLASVPGQDPGQEAQRRSQAKLATRSLATGPGQDPVAEAQMARAQGKAEGPKVKAKRGNEGATKGRSGRDEAGGTVARGRRRALRRKSERRNRAGGREEASDGLTQRGCRGAKAPSCRNAANAEGPRGPGTRPEARGRTGAGNADPQLPTVTLQRGYCTQRQERGKRQRATGPRDQARGSWGNWGRKRGPTAPHRDSAEGQRHPAAGTRQTPKGYGAPGPGPRPVGELGPGTRTHSSPP